MKAYNLNDAFKIVCFLRYLLSNLFCGKFLNFDNLHYLDKQIGVTNYIYTQAKSSSGIGFYKKLSYSLLQFLIILAINLFEFSPWN